MTADLKARLEAEAVRSGRSLNAEIISRLEHTLLGPPDSGKVSNDFKFELLVKTLELSHAARFAQQVKSFIPAEEWDKHSMKFFVKKYRLPAEFEAELEREYAASQSDLIKAILRDITPASTTDAAKDD